MSGDTPPLSARAFLLRLLNNLKQVYITLNMAEDALTIVRCVCAGSRAGWLLQLVSLSGKLYTCVQMQAQECCGPSIAEVAARCCLVLLGLSKPERSCF